LDKKQKGQARFQQRPRGGGFGEVFLEEGGSRTKKRGVKRFEAEGLCDRKKRDSPTRLSNGEKRMPKR